MDWRVQYLPEHRVVWAITAGTVTYTYALALTMDLARHLRMTEFNKFLIDHRAATIGIDKIDLYQLADEARNVGLGREFVGAIVVAGDARIDYRFYERSARCKGYHRRMFTDINMAWEWLKSVSNSE